jgi:hypothetical protein
VIPAVIGAARLLLVNQFRAAAQRAAVAETRSFARAEMKRLTNVTFELTGDKELSRRFVKLNNKIRKKMSWVAMQDALNEYRNMARKNWRAAPVKRARGKTRRAIASAYRIKRRDGDTLEVGVSYSKSKARVANLLEWNTRKTRGKRVGTSTFEDTRTRLLKIIAESLREQIYNDPENNKARRQAIRARVGAL